MRKPKSKCLRVLCHLHVAKYVFLSALVHDGALIPVAETKLNPENDEKAEEERKALLQALPTNLLNAIQAQKAMDREQDKVRFI